MDIVKTMLKSVDEVQIFRLVEKAFVEIGQI
jgi:hypothetical protein